MHKDLIVVAVVLAAMGSVPRVSRSSEGLTVPDQVLRCPTCGTPMVRGIGPAVAPRCPHGHTPGQPSPQSPTPPVGVSGPASLETSAPGVSASPVTTPPGITALESTAPGIVPPATMIAAPVAGGEDDGGRYASSSGPARFLSDSLTAIPLLGDQAPIINLRIRPPDGAAVNMTLVPKAKTVYAFTREFKITDNQSPLPLTRVYFNFNSFSDLNYAVIRKYPEAGIRSIQAYRYLLGFEKTFWGGRASFGLRDTLNTLSVVKAPGVLEKGETTTGFGDLSLYSKVVAWSNLKPPDGPGAGGETSSAFGPQGGLVSTGLSLRIPTGPGNFAGASDSKSFRDLGIQPFIGYYFGRGRFFLQGFEAIDVPTDRNDVTLIFTDIGIGYYAYRSADPSAWITSIAPTAEIHINHPTNHRGVFKNLTDPAATPEVVDLTASVNTLFGSQALLTLGVATPVTGPRPFSLEAQAMLNVFLGARRRASPVVAVPISGS